jgi:adenosylcobyric acid synthase
VLNLSDRTDGAVSEDGQVLGTYLHGLFESRAACDVLLAWAGLAAPRAPDYSALRQAGIDRLADAIEAHLDLAPLLALIGIGRQSVQGVPA